jgi:hypothetical protein
MDNTLRDHLLRLALAEGAVLLMGCWRCSW